ncbi:hypothetical protein SAMN05421743_11082 [Thalassobacillus cyri]|uniref:Uncharacterized protein n=1 Tax=Thalassobacillus cyri TaxID=571932 RepID=A0A1H4F1P0_9BACI|nr:hypothetical protein SAMN05421743_11082 [Thalassobacillus cyri]
MLFFKLIMRNTSQYHRSDDNGSGRKAIEGGKGIENS